MKKLKDLKDYRSISDPEVRDKIIVEYAPLVRYIAKKIAIRLPPNIELDDLISCGTIGLMDAIEKFDPTRYNKFKTYAEFRVRGAILDELRAQDWVPRSIREKAKMLERAYSKLEASLGRTATDNEMCEELNMTKDEFYLLLKNVKSISLLNIDDMVILNRYHKKIANGLAGSSKEADPLSFVNNKNSQELVKKSIAKLPENQRLVLSLYYYEGLNLREIGKVLDVTESRVSQLHTQAIIILRSHLRTFFDENAEDMAG